MAAETLTAPTAVLATIGITRAIYELNGGEYPGGFDPIMDAVTDALLDIGDQVAEIGRNVSDCLDSIGDND